MFQKNNGALPDNKEIFSSLIAKDSLKKVLKKVMPFVQMVKDNFAVIGVKAFEVGSPFDQAAVLYEVGVLVLTSGLHKSSLFLKIVRK